VVKYSSGAAAALAFLKRPYNDVDIYVEDTASLNMWMTLIKPLLGDQIKFDSVNMLGGRNTVLESCKLNQKDDGRRKLFIIDGDFDFLLGIPKPKLRYLYRIRGYCVENVLVREDGLLAVALEYSPNTPMQQLRALIDFKDWVEEHARLLSPLFVVYAATKMVAPEISTVAFAVQRLLRANPMGAELDRTKVTSRIRSVVRAASKKVGVAAFRQARLAVSRRAESLPLNQIVSGKDYLMPIILMRIKARGGYRGNADHLKVALAKNFDRIGEPWLARRVERLAA
jgi:hypothetical protein